MKKNVGLLISNLNAGGAERVVSRLSTILKEDYNIYVILFDASSVNYEYSGRLIDMNVGANKGNAFSKISLLLNRVRILRKIKKEKKLDLVISFLDSPNLVNILSKNNGCKTIVSVRNFLGKEKQTSRIAKISNIIMKHMYKQSDGVISVSKQITEFLIESYRVNKEKITTIYNPFDVKMIEKLSLEPIEEEYSDFMSSDKIFVSVGRQSYQKGFWHLLKAFKLVHDKDSEARLLIVGRDEDNSVENMITSLGLKESVLLTGYNQNPFKFIRNSKIYVLSSLFEGFPNALVEAMACGCPVIAADCKSGPREILISEPDLISNINEVTYADYGVLIPELESKENWDSSFYDKGDRILAMAMLDLINNQDKVNYYAEKSLHRSQDFTYARCRSEFNSFIDVYLKEE
ncbi:glycosyltransferase [Bacillus sp. 179-I 2A5 NHS]|uniref:glycosyltransferase n=1 Tax=Bacillus sp. 179-I 2A5 NHS TaxID=3374300 RepID=UPI003879A585